MRTLPEKGFAMIILIIVIVVAVGGASATAYYAKKSADNKKAQQLVQQTARDAAADNAKKPVEENKPSTENKPNVTPACVRDTKMYIDVPEGHALRSEKALNATKLVAVPYRSEVIVGCKDGDWYSAEFNGSVGWAYGQYLSTTQPPASTISTPTASICSQNSLTIYAAKSPTIGRYGNFDNPWSNGEKSVPFGTLMSGITCATHQNGLIMDGYMLYEDAYFRYADLSTTKP